MRRLLMGRRQLLPLAHLLSCSPSWEQMLTGQERAPRFEPGECPFSTTAGRLECASSADVSSFRNRACRPTPGP